MEALIKSLAGVLRHADPSPDVIEAAAKAAWKQAAGAGLKDHAVPVKLENSTLLVAVADAVWQKQLTTMCGQLLFRVNSTLGQPLVSRIEFVIDRDVVKVQPDRQESPDELADNEVPLELWSAANAIQDPKLRKSFLKAATRSLRRREK